LNNASIVINCTLGLSGERRASKSQRESMPMDDYLYTVGRPNNLRVEFEKK